MRLVFVICLLPFLGFTQQQKTVSILTSKANHYFDLYDQAAASDVHNYEGFARFIQKLQDKQPSFKSDKDFLRHVFLKTHQRYLKHFSEYANFSELSTNGNYNCLTGTALYALILDHFEIPYKIVETNYHIFLTASTSKGNILLEATDPMNGFVDNENDINTRIATYKQNIIAKKSAGKSYYQHDFNLYNEVSLDKMLGLLHYNMAIVAYNNHDLNTSVDNLAIAVELYASQRTEDFSSLVLLTLMEDSSMEYHAKDHCIKKVQSLREKRYPKLASAKSK